MTSQGVSSSLSESWERTKAHLGRAAGYLDDAERVAYEDALEHNELQLAADAIYEAAEARDDLPKAFWEALKYAYENQQLEREVIRCRFRMQEAEHGYVEALLALRATSEGGRQGAIHSEYFPHWMIGNRASDGSDEHNGARVSLEDRRVISPGEDGLVRLHPTQPECWTHVRVEQELEMYEGSRLVGIAVVTRVKLKPRA